MIGKSSSTLPYNRARGYINELNEDKIGGYDDWRFPTLEELSSLLKPKNGDGAYVDIQFNNSKGTFWTSDYTDGKFNTKARLIISFRTGMILLSEKSPYFSNFAATYDKHLENYVRAVRTVK